MIPITQTKHIQDFADPMNLTFYVYRISYDHQTKNLCCNTKIKPIDPSFLLTPHGGGGIIEPKHDGSDVI